ncbi:ADP-ribosylglycohydrolase family protein [Nostoc sp. TCL26-01]|uniref:ADP-ribosylglycohydrolase family protein n=1 Tax=Nostoc sp. TCL26-01 TaxID=2576904 RepID=UPI0015C0E682|nr:ADP-ribosylglycohydrolase family protein [Nostoc sp. TCL26-01]QLE54404.1 ADP-ribosylglycohydrolase family protein [Nostoc sp. TCL26-01]
MRYSLVSRFRGTLLGTVIGAGLVPGGEAVQQTVDSQIIPAVITGCGSLVRLGRLDLDDWREIYQQEFFSSGTAESITLKIILATIPVALFFHENPVKLQQNLLEVVKIWSDDAIIRDGTLAIGYAIAQSLTEKLQPQTLIPQIISFIGDTHTSIPQNLLKVNQAVTQGSGLTRLLSELNGTEKLSSALAVGFYCFLSTLEDLRLTMLQTVKLNSVYAQTIIAITGALSGSYNSTVGIPVNWQVALLGKNSAATGESKLWQMLELGDALAAVWSGVYHLTAYPREFSEHGCIMFEQQVPLSVYAAPRIIRGH